MVMTLDLAARKQAAFATAAALCPDIVKRHAAHAFTGIPAEHHEPISQEFLTGLNQGIQTTIDGFDEATLTAYEQKLANGAIASAMDPAILEGLHSSALYRRIGDPLAESCETMGIPMFELRGSNVMPSPKGFIDNKAYPLAVSQSPDGSVAMIARPEVAHFLADDELHLFSVHEGAHIKRGDLQKAKKAGISISREAEFAADEMAARVTGKPRSLISGLRKLEAWERQVDEAVAERVTSKIYGWVKKISPATYEKILVAHKSPQALSTAKAPSKFWNRIKHGGEHPSYDERIERLEKIAQELEAKAAAWHPADETARVWAKEVEGPLSRAAEILTHHPFRI